MVRTWQADLKYGKMARMAESEFGFWPASPRTIALPCSMRVHDGRRGGMPVGTGEKAEAAVRHAVRGSVRRKNGEHVALTGFGGSCVFVDRERRILVTTTIHDDHGGVGRIDLSRPHEILPVRMAGVKHWGTGS